MARTTIDQQARELGYQLTQGAYSGTSDDVIGTWYAERLDSDTVDRRGRGYATKREALDMLRQALDAAE